MARPGHLLRPIGATIARAVDADSPESSIGQRLQVALERIRAGAKRGAVQEDQRLATPLFEVPNGAVANSSHMLAHRSLPSRPIFPVPTFTAADRIHAVVVRQPAAAADAHVRLGVSMSLNVNP